MSVVLDASAVGAFLLPEEPPDLALLAREVCRSEQLYVPYVWRSEVSNLLVKAHRRGRITLEQLQAATAGADIVAQSVIVSDEEPLMAIIEGAMATKLSGYDFTYYALARRLDLPLLTGDGPLRRAARAGGVALRLP